MQCISLHAMEVSIEKDTHYSEFRLMSIRIWIGCCTICAETEFGGISAEFYRPPRFPALPTTHSTGAPFSVSMRCPVNDSKTNAGWPYSACSFLDIFPVNFLSASAIEFRVLAKLGRIPVVSVHYAYWRIETRRSHDTACTHLGHQH